MILNVSNTEPKTKVQKTMTEMFGIKSGNRKPPEVTIKKKVGKVNPKQHCTLKAFASGVKNKSETSRTVSVSTVENWKSELSDLNVAEWLTYDVDSDGKAKNLKCKYCIMFQDAIKDLPNFSDIFIHGSTNYRKSGVEHHARNKTG